MSCLHLIPVGLGQTDLNRWLAPQVRETTARLRVFIAENAKTARAFLKASGTATALQEIIIHELRADTRGDDINAWLDQLPADEDIGLVSEAGCPAVADPGAKVVAQAHARRMRVIPWTGPSSIMLGLMASGLEGQRFAFHGYAPIKTSARDAQLRRWESASRHQDQTQILIETPYRNANLFGALLRVLQDNTRLCVACALTCDDEWIATRTIAQWRKAGPPPFEKRPTLFLYLAG